MSKKYNLAVFIGRFQPLHNEHIRIIREALNIAEKVVVFIGTTNVARTPKNPFTVEERAKMIFSVFPNETNLIDPRLLIRTAFDNPANDMAWAAHIQAEVAKIEPDDSKVTLIGCHKDNGTSFYLKMFRQWHSYAVPHEVDLNATDIRRVWFGDYQNIDETHGIESPFIRNSIPDVVRDFMHCDFSIVKYHWLRDEYYFYKKYDPKQYPVTIICADAVVTQSNYILLVTRDKSPGKGLLALPGGHVEQNERVIDAAVRELKEETKISDERGEIPFAVLKSFIKNDQGRLFDNPSRSLRGRVITTAYHFLLPDKRELYKVKGSDDARDAKWYSIGTLKPEDFFEDHYYIIKNVLGL